METSGLPLQDQSILQNQHHVGIPVNNAIQNQQNPTQSNVHSSLVLPAISTGLLSSLASAVPSINPVSWQAEPNSLHHLSGEDQQIVIQAEHLDSLLKQVPPTIQDDSVTEDTKLWVISIGNKPMKLFQEIAIKKQVWCHASPQDRGVDIKKDDYILFGAGLSRQGATQGFNRSQTECYGTLKQMMLVRINSVEETHRELDTFRNGTNQWIQYPYGYSFSIIWTDTVIEFTAEKFSKPIMEARRRSDIGGGINIKADVDAQTIIHLKHRKDLDLAMAATNAALAHDPNMNQNHPMKRSHTDANNDQDMNNPNGSNEIDMLNNSGSNELGSPDKKKQKKLAKTEVDITEVLQLPIRLRLTNKAQEFWCQLEAVDADQEVKAILLEAYEGSGPQRFPNLSAAAKHVTGLETANGWKKWYFLYKGKWMPIGCFRKPGSTPRLTHDFKDQRIKPRGRGFINANATPSEDDPNNLSVLLSATQSPLGEYNSYRKDIEPKMVKCLLSYGDDKKKMIFFPEDKVVADMLMSIGEEFGHNLVFVVDGYDVEPQTKLVHLSAPGEDGKVIVTGHLKMK